MHVKKRKVSVGILATVRARPFFLFFKDAAGAKFLQLFNLTRLQLTQAD